MMAASRASWEKELRLFLSLVLSREINKTCSIYSRLHVFPHILRLTVVDQPCCAWDIWGILLNFHCHILRFVYFFYFWKWAKILNLFLIGFFFFHIKHIGTYQRCFSPPSKKKNYACHLEKFRFNLLQLKSDFCFVFKKKMQKLWGEVIKMLYLELHPDNHFYVQRYTQRPILNQDQPTLMYCWVSWKI